MLNTTTAISQEPSGLPLVDFGQLQQRYNSMKLAKRAETVLADAEPALKMATDILTKLQANAKTANVLETIQKNPAIVGKMRPSEAKNMLLDEHKNFIETTCHKLAVWRKTMERVAAGEGVVADKEREYISSHLPVAVAVSSIGAISAYLAIVQLTLAELAKTDGKNAAKYQSDLAKIRRCATFLSDCDLASSISVMVN